MKINQTHPVRRAIANVQTYHKDTNAAMEAVDRVLSDHKIVADWDNMDERGVGYFTVPLLPRFDQVCGCCEKKLTSYNHVLVFSIYDELKNSVELTTYVS